jgi:hypothetical protein
VAISQWSVLAEELKAAGAVHGIESFEETAAEQAGEHAYRQEESRPARDPGQAVG